MITYSNQKQSLCRSGTKNYEKANHKTKLMEES